MNDPSSKNSTENEPSVSESVETAFLPVDWAIDPEKLRSMTPEERMDYDVEVAEKISRLHAAQQELAVILTAARIRFEGETPRVIIDRTLNPDKEEYQKPDTL